MNTTATPKKDLYAQVTDSIIAMMEAGATSRITWAQTGHGMPCNHKTGAPYQGVNVLLLWAETMIRGYSTDRWLTYKQAAELGGQVRKGKKACNAFFLRRLNTNRKTLKPATTAKPPRPCASFAHSGCSISTRSMASKRHRQPRSLASSSRSRRQKRC